MRFYFRAIRHGLERIFSLPRLSLPIVMTLSLTLAAVLTVTSMVSNLMLKPLPDISDEHNLYRLSYNIKMSEELDVAIFTEQRIAALSQQYKGLGEFSTYHARERELDISGNIYTATRLRASLNFIDNVTRLSVLTGESPNTNNLANSVWISESLWKTAFKQGENVIGQTIVLEENTYQIRGVIEDFSSFKSFDEKHPQQVWRFLDSSPLLGEADTGFFGGLLTILYRTQSQALLKEDIDSFWSAYLKNHTELNNLARFTENTPVVFAFDSYRTDLMGSQNVMVFILLATVLALLLMACLNLLNLFMSHYQQRSTEFGTQVFLGANMRKLRMMMVLENTPIFLSAAIIGVIGAAWVIRLLPQISGGNIALLELIHIDSFTVATGISIVLLVNIAFTYLTSLQFDNQQLLTQLNSGNKGIKSARMGLLPKSLFVAQITFAVVILTGSAMLAQHAFKKLTIDLGFDIGNTAVAVIELEGEAAALPEDEKQRAEELFKRSQQNLNEHRQLKQSLNSAYSKIHVIDSQDEPFGLMLPLASAQNPASDETVSFGTRNIAPDYWEAFKINLLFGRNMSQDEFINGANVALINIALAELISTNDDPKSVIGTEFYGQQIIGIVANNYDIMERSGAGHPTIFYTYRNTSLFVRLVMQLPQGAAYDEQGITDTLSKAYPHVKNVRFTHLNQYWHDANQNERIQFYFIACIAFLTLVLASLGSIGMATNYTEIKRFELAIRMATGSPRIKLLLKSVASFKNLLASSFIASGVVAPCLYLYLQKDYPSLPEFSWPSLAIFYALLISLVLASVILVIWRIINKDPMRALRDT